MLLLELIIHLDSLLLLFGLLQGLNMFSGIFEIAVVLPFSPLARLLRAGIFAARWARKAILDKRVAKHVSVVRYLVRISQFQPHFFLEYIST